MTPTLVTVISDSYSTVNTVPTLYNRYFCSLRVYGPIYSPSTNINDLIEIYRYIKIVYIMVGMIDIRLWQVKNEKTKNIDRLASINDITYILCLTHYSTSFHIDVVIISLIELAL